MLIEAMRLPVASADDLKRAAIWSLGMTLFVLLNPCIKYPYFEEIQQALKERKTPIQALEEFFKARNLPMEPCKYQHKHATDWYSVHKIWCKCLQFDPVTRPKIEEVVSMISQDSTISALNIHLKVSRLLFILIETCYFLLLYMVLCGIKAYRQREAKDSLVHKRPLTHFIFIFGLLCTNESLPSRISLAYFLKNKLVNERYL